MPKIRTAARMLSIGLAGALRRDIKLDAPPMREPDPTDKALVERIAAAFRASRAAQPPQWSRPADIWRRQLSVAYASLYGGDPSVAYFLENFGQWPLYTGIEDGGYHIQRYGRFPIGRSYAEEILFRRQLRAWSMYDRPLSRLALPRHGNQAGAWVNGQFVSAGAPGNDLLAAQILRLTDSPRPVLAELGGGYGKLAYCVLRDLKDFCYVGFDLPETLCTAAYYLQKCFPEKRVLLFGEREFTPASLGEYDIILMPAWEIAKLADVSIDVFWNKNSLGEMNAESAHAYVAHIARATRCYFFHVNHDGVRCADGDWRGLLASEYTLPPEFRLLLRQPDVSDLLWQDRPDIFQYLYARSRHSDLDHAAITVEIADRHAAGGGGRIVREVPQARDQQGVGAGSQ